MRYSRNRVASTAIMREFNGYHLYSIGSVFFFQCFLVLFLFRFYFRIDIKCGMITASASSAVGTVALICRLRTHINKVKIVICCAVTVTYLILPIICYACSKYRIKSELL